MFSGELEISVILQCLLKVLYSAARMGGELATCKAQSPSFTWYPVRLFPLHMEMIFSVYAISLPGTDITLLSV